MGVDEDHADAFRPRVVGDLDDERRLQDRGVRVAALVGVVRHQCGVSDHPGARVDVMMGVGDSASLAGALGEGRVA